MKQSSIEWFSEKAFSPFITEENYNEILLQAKMMHYSEIKNSYKKGYDDKDLRYFDPEHYYSETFE